MKCKDSTHKGALSKQLHKRPWDPDFVPEKKHLLVVDFNLKQFHCVSFLLLHRNFLLDNKTVPISRVRPPARANLKKEEKRQCLFNGIAKVIFTSVILLSALPLPFGVGRN